ncbi:NUDIX domain-containing protein [Flavobacteriales bacterium]|nr:NUDIX domain-containing protein [Flavobacteriales bacterium]
MKQKYKVYINNKPKIITDNWEDFCARYKLIKAAGGVVYNIDNQLLMIFRNGKWDLPKGKLETDEDIKICAIREVEEECGVTELQIIKKLIDTYHTYELKGKHILKRTFWFKMKTNFNGILKPQTEEEITEVCWVHEEDVAEKLNNSFEIIKQLLNNDLH